MSNHQKHRSFSDDEIARYVLGLDMPDRAASIQSRLAHDDAAAARALKWEAYFLGIVDALPVQPVPDTVLERIRLSLSMTAEDLPITGETRAPGTHPHSAPADEPPRKRTWRDMRIRRGRVALVLGIGAILCVAGLALWASLRPAPSGTIVQIPVQLENH